jgi:hypothetical protein
MRSATLADQGRILERLGMPRKDAAALLGTTDESLRVMLTQARKKSRGSTKSPTKQKLTTKRRAPAKANAPARKKLSVKKQVPAKKRAPRGVERSATKRGR